VGWYCQAVPMVMGESQGCVMGVPGFLHDFLGLTVDEKNVDFAVVGHQFLALPTVVVVVLLGHGRVELHVVAGDR
jgi:hypothetical protein